MQTKEYILGSHDTEIARLLLQHRVWRPRMLDSWRKAGITTGQTIIDLGCGPGYASTELAEIAGPRGHVLAIDRSPRFLQRLQRQCDAYGVTNIETREADITSIDLRGIDAHALWCRWVFSWLPNPAPAIASIRDSLRPGGVAVFHEYLNYSTWKLAPASPAFEKFVTAVINSTARTGANIDSAAFLPSLLEANDMEILALNPIMDVVEPLNFVWQWPAAFMREFAPTLVRTGDLTPEDEVRAIEALASAEKSEVVRMVTPVVLEIIARRQ